MLTSPVYSFATLHIIVIKCISQIHRQLYHCFVQYKNSLPCTSVRCRLLLQTLQQQIVHKAWTPQTSCYKDKPCAVDTSVHHSSWSCSWPQHHNLNWIHSILSLGDDDEPARTAKDEIRTKHCNVYYYVLHVHCKPLTIVNCLTIMQ